MAHRDNLNPHHAVYGSLAFLMLVLGAPQSHAERYVNDVRLTGTAVPSEHMSGFKGTAFELGIPDSAAPDEYAIFGIASEERKDHPCYVTVKTENVNDPNLKLDLKKELCDGKERSKEIVAAYTDSSYGKRSFVTGVRVCMNNDNTRVKGIQIRGGAINEEGRLSNLEPNNEGQSVAGIRRVAPEEPRDERPNCNNNWRRWALCPGDNHIATAVELHFEAGKEPRSLTGIALKCRQVSAAGSGTGAVRP
ncbi:MAG: hypothetical protein A4E19_15440 [Nitrospira sp. SG-bin1]|nr:MAG: hypothetical protein A4E19_15440 [Nitrospira sp. SG-bin1]